MFKFCEIKAYKHDQIEHGHNLNLDDFNILLLEYI